MRRVRPLGIAPSGVSDRGALGWDDPRERPPHAEAKAGQTLLEEIARFVYYLFTGRRARRGGRR